MKILITGGTGFIGSQLVKALRSQAHEITLLIRPNESAVKRDDIDYSIGDITKPASLSIRTPFDVVIHLAGLTHSRKQSDYFRVNTEGTKNLLAACETANSKHFVYISSRTASVAGGAYAHSKLLAEQAVEHSSILWTILQPAEVYGGGNRDAISKLVSMIKQKKIIPIVGDGSYELAPVHVDDVVQAITACIGNTAVIGKKYVIAGPESLPFSVLIQRVAFQYQLSAKTIHLPLALVRPAITFLSFFAPNLIVRDQLPRLLCPKLSTITAARQDLHFNPRTIETGLPLHNFQH